ncbi:MAG TPA: M28 family metallopeptidase [Solirubrobacterales bacterium]|nr:M28 family metallopeptidase [Solirubrobacterales bacterium]
MSLLRAQVAVGQRPAGSPQLRNLAVTLRDTMASAPGSAIRDVHFEPFPSSGAQQGLRNIIGVLPGRAPAILIGAHYDSEWHPKGFVGANDSAAGTAAVMELARSLPAELPKSHREIRFVLFDGEEDPPGCTDQDFQFCALRGSRAYAGAHPGQVGDMILLDYIANRGARIAREQNSNQALWEQLRQAAAEVGAAEIFPPGIQGGVIDDHYPFLEQGVPSIDLIDFSYPYADTVEDTVDKLDPAVLDKVGEAVAQLVVNMNGGG